METSNPFSSLADEEASYNEGQNFYVPREKASDDDEDQQDAPRGVFENGVYRRIPRGRGGAARVSRHEQVRTLQEFGQRARADHRGARPSALRSRGTERGRSVATGRLQPHSEGPKNVFGESTKAPRASFPRVIPLNVSVNMQKEAHRMHNQVIGDSIGYLREVPDEDDYSSLKGVFLWPSEDSGIDPMRTEDPRLDEIRRRHSCHIVLAHNPRRLCIYDSDDIGEDDNSRASAALEAIRNLLQEILQRSSQCMRFILAHPPASYESQPIIRMIAPSSSRIISQYAAGLPSQEGKIALAEQSLAEYNDSWQAYAHQQAVKNALTLEMALAKSLERLVVSPGRVEIKAILGSFVFRRIAQSAGSQQSGSSVRAFMTNLRSTKCEGSLFRLSSKANLFDRVLAREDVLMAYQDGKQCSLADVQPSYVGVFTFPPYSGDAVDRQLSVEARVKVVESDVRISLQRFWTSPVERAVSRRLEAFVTSLDGGLSWKLEAVAHPYCRNISDALQRFQSKVTPSDSIRHNIASIKPGATELMFEYPQGDGYRLKDFYQRTQWKFFSKVNHHYVLQVSRLDRFQEVERTAGAHEPSRIQRRPTQTQWEACVFDERWEDILGQNAALSIGESANWETSIAKFFPSQSSRSDGQSAGFADFVDCVNALCQGLSGGKAW